VRGSQPDLCASTAAANPADRARTRVAVHPGVLPAPSLHGPQPAQEGSCIGDRLGSARGSIAGTAGDDGNPLVALIARTQLMSSVVIEAVVAGHRLGEEVCRGV